jgi:lipopolysaccharide/colanic/teichoic acid biosynthesis glycosyltransferase
MQRLKLLLVDLVFFGASPFAALLLRENFETPMRRLDDLFTYAAVLVAVASVVLVATGLNRGVWRFTSYAETPRLLAAVTISLLLALFVTFGFNRLSGVSRSLPLIQWFLIVAAMLAVRLAARWWMLRRRRRTQEKTAAPGERQGGNVLVVGMNEIAFLYIRAVGEYARGTIRVAGILAKQGRHRGRLVQLHPVLGTYDDLKSALAELEVHGVFVDRIVIAEPVESLPAAALALLREVASEKGIELDFIVESLGLAGAKAASGLPWAGLATPATASRLGRAEGMSGVTDAGRRPSPLGSYAFLKRGLDILGAGLLVILCLPLFLVAAAAVAIDIGLPLMFWQQRTGLDRRPFRVWKFRTMLAPYDADGRRMPDEARVTPIGNLLRRMRLDELPQLFAVIAGNMSFIGPRPVLPIDQPPRDHDRFLIRPGLTGWSQIQGGRAVSVAERAALDAWYVRHASPALDLKILAGTARMLLLGERRNEPAIAEALAEVSQRADAGDGASADARLLSGLSTQARAVGAG